MQYVYRFKNQDNEIIYIGITDNIKKRMLQHFGTNGHLPSECYDSVKTIEYITLKNRDDVELAEKYFISKLQPVFNTVMKKKQIHMDIFELDTKKWLNFDDFSQFKNETDLHEDLLDYKFLIDNYNDKIKKLDGEMNGLRDIYDELYRDDDDNSGRVKEVIDNKWVEFNKLKQLRIELIQEQIIKNIGLQEYRKMPKWRKMLYNELGYIDDEQIINIKIAEKVEGISADYVAKFKKRGYIEKFELMHEIAEIFRIWAYREDENWLNIFTNGNIDFGCYNSIVLKTYAERYFKKIFEEIILHIGRITSKSLEEKQMIVKRNLSLSLDSLIVETLIIAYQAA